ncbi:hypothetical protein RJ639_003078 [Escallonia herrerae]|uniref:Transcription repressor n=1 Tax=Escallonia herrerae TaxID=1293975 RepID=A0AA88W0R7_9ASTE|nr:hypothetical protein RJ639_003078 [Escallonia herrerae]
MPKNARFQRAEEAKASVTDCRTLCCSFRLSISSSGGTQRQKFRKVPNYLHPIACSGLGKIEQMIKERQEARHRDRRRPRREGSKFIVMLTTEMSSYDPREDFRESMVEMIMTKRISEPKDLCCLLNCYVSMNSEEYRVDKGGAVDMEGHVVAVEVVDLEGAVEEARQAPNLPFVDNANHGEHEFDPMQEINFDDNLSDFNPEDWDLDVEINPALSNTDIINVHEELSSETSMVSCQPPPISESSSDSLEILAENPMLKIHAPVVAIESVLPHSHGINSSDNHSIHSLSEPSLMMQR